MHWIPKSLADVATASDRRKFTSFLKELIDLVIAHARTKGFDFSGDLPLPHGLMDAAPPETVEPWMRAYLCALAEHLADMAGVPAPGWSDDGFLDEPMFVGGPRAQEDALKDTPPAFRRRLLFPGKVMTKLEVLRRTD